MPLSASLAGLALVVIGESHMAQPHYLLDPLHQALTERGAQVHSIGVCGASPGKWVRPARTDCGKAEKIGSQPPTVEPGDADGTNIVDVLNKERPDAIIVVNGDTVGSYDKAEFPQSWAYQEVTTLTRAIAATGVACYWVGPGWGQADKRYNKAPELVQRVNAFLAENVAPCTYIDSTKFSQPGEWKTTDGQHYTTKYYRKWADAIANAIESTPPKKRSGS